jgi:hypothetical protein
MKKHTLQLYYLLVVSMFLGACSSQLSLNSKEAHSQTLSEAVTTLGWPLSLRTLQKLGSLVSLNRKLLLRQLRWEEELQQDSWITTNQQQQQKDMVPVWLQDLVQEAQAQQGQQKGSTWQQPQQDQQHATQPQLGVRKPQPPPEQQQEEEEEEEDQPSNDEQGTQSLQGLKREGHGPLTQQQQLSRHQAEQPEEDQLREESQFAQQLQEQQQQEEDNKAEQQQRDSEQLQEQQQLYVSQPQGQQPSAIAYLDQQHQQVLDPEQREQQEDLQAKQQTQLPQETEQQQQQQQQVQSQNSQEQQQLQPQNQQELRNEQQKQQELQQQQQPLNHPSSFWSVSRWKPMQQPSSSLADTLAAQHGPPAAERLSLRRRPYPHQYHALHSRSHRSNATALVYHGLHGEKVFYVNKDGRLQPQGWPHGYVAICAIVKDQKEDLQEWVMYHKWLGVSKIYLFDHNSTVRGMEFTAVALVLPWSLYANIMSFLAVP